MTFSFSKKRPKNDLLMKFHSKKAKTNKTNLKNTFFLLRKICSISGHIQIPQNSFQSHKNVVGPNAISSKIGKTCFNDVFDEKTCFNDAFADNNDVRHRDVCGFFRRFLVRNVTFRQRCTK